MLKELDRCRREGTPRDRKVRPYARMCRLPSGRSPTPGVTYSTTGSPITHQGALPHLCFALGVCEFCGNQRSDEIGQTLASSEADYMDLINFETSARYDDRQKAALAYAECITWDLPADDKLWARLHQHFSEPELVEIGYFVAITMGQQRWLRTLNIEHHQVLAGTDASMAPGFETMDALKKSKSDPQYWAKSTIPPKSSVA